MRSDEDLREQEAQKRYGQSYGSLLEFDRRRIDHIVGIDEKARRSVNPVHPRTGLTDAQFEHLSRKFAKAIAEGLAEQLPELVRSHVEAALPKLVEPLIAKAISTLELRTATGIESAIAAAEAATSAIGRASGPDDATTAKLDSLERRASRHADHLSALESRLKKLELNGL